MRPFEDGDTIAFSTFRVQPSSKVSDDFGAQVRYWKMRIAGESHAMAEMLATRSFPGIKGTDSSFMRGTHHQDTQLDRIRYGEAAANGIDTNGKRYLAGLARFPGDPEAWISGQSDVLRICRDRGWNCHGMVDYEAPPVEATPDIPIGEDIVDFHVNSCLEAFDERERTPQLIEDIRETVTQELTGEVDLSPDPRVSDYDDPWALPGMQPD
jgi:hypothetical protein